MSSFIVLVTVLQPTRTVRIEIADSPTSAGNTKTEPIAIPNQSGSPVITIPIVKPCIPVPLLLFDKNGEGLFNEATGKEIKGPFGRTLLDAKMKPVFGPKDLPDLFQDFQIKKCTQKEVDGSVKFGFKGYDDLFKKVRRFVERIDKTKMPQDLEYFLKQENFYDKCPILPNERGVKKIKKWFEKMTSHACEDRKFVEKGPAEYILKLDSDFANDLYAKPKNFKLVKKLKKLKKRFVQNFVKSRNLKENERILGFLKKHPKTLNAESGLKNGYIWVFNHIGIIDDPDTNQFLHPGNNKAKLLKTCSRLPSEEFQSLIDLIFPREFLKDGLPVPGNKGGHLVDQFGRTVFGPRVCKDLKTFDSLRFFVAQKDKDEKIKLFDPTGELAPRPVGGRPSIVVGNSLPDSAEIKNQNK